MSKRTVNPNIDMVDMTQAEIAMANIDAIQAFRPADYGAAYDAAIEAGNRSAISGGRAEWVLVDYQVAQLVMDWMMDGMDRMRRNGGRSDA